MNKNDNLLINNTERLFQQTIKRFGDDTQHIINYDKLKKHIDNQLDLYREKFVELGKDMEIGWLKKFFGSPQIKDLLEDYLYYLLYTNAFKAVPKKKISQEDLINYLIGVNERHFSQYMNDCAIVSLRKYFQCIFEMSSAKLDDEVFYGYIIKEEKSFGKLFSQGDKRRETLADNLVERVESMLKYDLIPSNRDFEDTRGTYMKSLKQYYQNGFIYLLGEYKFNDFYIPPILMNDKSSYHLYGKSLSNVDNDWISFKRKQWKYIFNNKDILYVVGGAGYGKSLFLRNIVNNYSKLDLEDSQNYLVICCDLKTYYTNGDCAKKTMIDFFQESMIATTGSDNISKEFIRYYIDIGRCIILLDALDEVPKEVRNDLHKKIVAFFSGCNSHNKVCITSRDRGFLPQQDIDVYEILPLKELPV